MRVLVGCEFSGVVRRAFRERGHEAYSCDLLPAEDCSPYHFETNVLNILDMGWDLAIFHPPCTYLTNSGVRWLYKKDGERNEERWQALTESTVLFQKLLDAPIKKIVIENPIMHKHARTLISQSYTQIIQPWQFGHGETKATCLWLKNVPPLQPTNIVKGREGRVHQLPPSTDRWKLRSITYQGIANAMAEQWGDGK